MNTCLVHGQMYPLGSFCPYCGPPPNQSVTTGGSLPFQKCNHEWNDFTYPICKHCGMMSPTGQSFSGFGKGRNQ